MLPYNAFARDEKGSAEEVGILRALPFAGSDAAEAQANLNPLSMAKRTWDAMVAYKLVWFRVLGFFLVPAWLMWEAQTKGMTGAMWYALSGFERFNIICSALAAGLIPFLAFLDQSLNRAKADLEAKHAHDSDPDNLELIRKTVDATRAMIEEDKRKKDDQ